MVEVEVLTLIVMNGDMPSFLVLKPVDEPAIDGKSRIVPICVGPSEAHSLGVVLEDTHYARPITHDLMLDALTNLDARVDHAVINDVQGATFLSRLVLAQHDRLIDLDSRPSDAISLALRQGAPLYIDESVLDRASYPFLLRDHDDEERTVNDFKRFLQSLNPSDFNL